MGEYGPELSDAERIEQIIEELCIQSYIGYDNHQTISLIVSALCKLHLSQGFASNPKIEQVMKNYTESKHVTV